MPQLLLSFTSPQQFRHSPSLHSENAKDPATDTAIWSVCQEEMPWIVRQMPTVKTASVPRQTLVPRARVASCDHIGRRSREVSAGERPRHRLTTINSSNAEQIFLTSFAAHGLDNRVETAALACG